MRKEEIKIFKERADAFLDTALYNGSSKRNDIQTASNLLEKVATNGIDFIPKKCYFIDRAIKKLASSSHQNNPRHVKLLRQFPRSDVLAPNSGRSVTKGR